MFPLWAIKPCSLQVFPSIYMQMTSILYLSVIIGPTICKGHTPILITQKGSVLGTVCALVCGDSMPMCVSAYEYFCVWLYLAALSGEIQSGKGEPSSPRLLSQSRHISDVNLKMKYISQASSLSLLGHFRYWEGSPYIWGTLGLVYLLAPQRLLFHLCPCSGTIDPLWEVSISFPG